MNVHGIARYYIQVNISYIKFKLRGSLNKTMSYLQKCLNFKL